MAGKTSKKSAKVAKKAPAKPRKPAPKPQSGKAAKPVLLSGGNPQIAKGYGDAPVQAYIAAMPGWKRDLGRRLDALIVRTVPGVRKAVKWNSPFYGVEDDGLVPQLSLLHEVHEGDVLPRHVAASCPPRRVQAQGRALPRHPRGRQFDEAQFVAWVKQASHCPANECEREVECVPQELRYATTSGEISRPSKGARHDKIDDAEDDPETPPGRWGSDPAHQPGRAPARQRAGREAGGPDYAVFTEISPESKLLKAGWNTRVFTNTDSRNGNAIRCDFATGIVTVAPGTYHISGMSIVTYNTGGEPPEMATVRAPASAGYCRLRLVGATPDNPENIKNEHPSVKCIGSGATANMGPSLFETYLTTTARRRKCFWSIKREAIPNKSTCASTCRIRSGT